MDKHSAVQYMLDKTLVAVIRADTADGLVNVVAAIAAGGIQVIEVTMNTPGALSCLETAAERLAGQDVMLGVGTVLDAETCRMAILSGAEFVVTPTVSIPAIQMARRYGKPVVAGAYTPTEVMTAWEAGADFVKVFPSSIGGPAYIKALKGPLAQVALVPTGGVNEDNAADFLKAGASALAVGGILASKDLIAAGDFDAIRENARRLVDVVEAAKKEMAS